jgi:hypothetical protein
LPSYILNFDFVLNSTDHYYVSLLIFSSVTFEKFISIAWNLFLPLLTATALLDDGLIRLSY